MSHKLSYVLAALVTATTAGPTAANIISTADLTVITPQFLTITVNALVSNPQLSLPSQIIFAEQQNVTLAAPLAVDTGNPIPAGTIVSSYFFIVNDNKTVTASTFSFTSVTFDSPRARDHLQ